ncbi:hypothetical protein SUGI_0537160 [Cryptomeria japonica]|nr:hypothetical protein SUGI_0537160 [Cryptomeria japonica]
MIIPNFIPSTERANEEVFTYSSSNTQSKDQEKQPMVSPSQRGRTRWNIADTIVLIEAKRSEKDAVSKGGAMKKTISSAENYWNVTSKERVERKLPPNFPSKLMDAMEITFGSDRVIDPGNITIDTLENNSSPKENTPIDEFDMVKTAC